MAVTRELRFPFDEKGYKSMVERLPGTAMSYWEGDSLRRGRVVSAEVQRDRYGNPFVQVELEELKPGEPAAAGEAPVS